jgi:hypothetical protein
MSREAMKMALEALESDPISHAGLVSKKQAITALRQALETEQEPVAWANSSDLQNFDMRVRTGPDLNHTVPLYTAPPKRELTCVCGAVWEGETMVHPPREREWVGLTDREITKIGNLDWDSAYVGIWYDFARAIEQALKDKNHGTGRVYADETKIPEDVPCKTHPDAPHGFDRNMSHTLDRYVCECEHWEPSESWEPSK